MAIRQKMASDFFAGLRLWGFRALGFGALGCKGSEQLHASVSDGGASGFGPL